MNDVVRELTVHDYRGLSNTLTDFVYFLERDLNPKPISENLIDHAIEVVPASDTLYHKIQQAYMYQEVDKERSIQAGKDAKALIELRLLVLNNVAV